MLRSTRCSTQPRPKRQWEFAEEEVLSTAKGPTPQPEQNDDEDRVKCCTDRCTDIVNEYRAGPIRQRIPPMLKRPHYGATDKPPRHRERRKKRCDPCNESQR